MVLALILLAVCGTVVIGILGFASAQTRNFHYNRTKMAAQYVAEAGAKTGIARLNGFLRTNNNIISDSNISALTFSGSPVILPNGSYVLNYSPDFNSPSLVSQINIRCTGTVNGVSYTAKVAYALQNSTLYVPGPGVVDLFNGATYSSLDPDKIPIGAQQPWTVTPASGTTPASATPPTPKSKHYQVKFGDRMTKDYFTINYIGSCLASETIGNGNSGYGIYYGLSPDCTPDNPDGYVFQYDPGAGSKGSFFVKRVKARDSNPAQASDNEYNYAKNDYYAGTGHYETRTTGSGWNKKTVTVWVQDISPTSVDTPFQPSTPANKTWVALQGRNNSLESEMGPGFDINAPHKITIEITPDLRHIISCDGVKILDFVDNTAGKITSFVGTSTGLRSWNAEVGFYNSPSSSMNQGLNSWIVWQK